MINPTTISSSQHQASISITAPLKDQILAQNHEYSLDCTQVKVDAKRVTQKLYCDRAKNTATTLRDKILCSLQHVMDLTQKKGDSSWLTSLPLKEFGFTLHKGAYRDAIALHYGWQPSYCPSSCACGSNVSVERTLSCPKGSFPTICHNEVRDFTANLMTVVCHDFCVEPSLQPIGEVFSNATAILMTVPDSTLQQMDFGVVILREPSSMCEFSTPMLLQTDNNSPPAIKKEKEKSLNKEFVKLSIVPSFLWSCH